MRLKSCKMSLDSTMIRFMDAKIFLLSWEANSELDKYPACGMYRWKYNDNSRKRIPKKVLRHFSLISRLKHLLTTKDIVIDMRWHKKK